MNLLEKYDSHHGLEVLRIASVEEARAGDLIFISQVGYLRDLGDRCPLVAVTTPEIAKHAQHLKCPVLLTHDPMLAFAKCSELFSTENAPELGIHPTALIHPSAQIGKNVSIGAFVVVEADARIGDFSHVQTRCSIGPRAVLGKNCHLFTGVVVYQDTHMGDRVRIHANSVIGADGFGYVQERIPHGVKHVKLHHLGRVIIGNDVEIGASTTIDRGTLGETQIGNGCMIDNNVQIGHNCKLAEGVIICGNTGLSGSVTVDAFAVVAGHVGVANKVRIGTGAKIAGFSAIFGSIPAGTVWGGVPARPQRETLRLQAFISRLPLLFEERKNRKKDV